MFSCLILGGSAQGIWQNMLLQLAGVAIIAWAALDRRREPLTAAARALALIAILAIAVIALQMIPLPSAIWPHLGPRQDLANAFRLLGLPVPAQPLSLAPAAGLNSLLGIIPPIAMVCAMLQLNAYRPHWLAIALIAGTVAGVALGAVQVASSGSGLSPFYLYAETNVGRGVGFFANANHMAILLVITIPFLAAIAASQRRAGLQRYTAAATVAAGIAILVLVGIFLNRSLAGYGLGLAVLPFSALILLPAGSRMRPWSIGIGVLIAVASLAALELTPIGGEQLSQDTNISIQSRRDILATTSRAAADFMPFGSGLGSFTSIYPMYERPEQVTTTFVIHAHNDFAEIALELGLAGVILILLFLAWWTGAVWRVWRTPEAGPYARAAAIASAAILIHSLVDFPLRTEAIATCFGMCLALLADSRAAPPKESTELRRTRHVTV
jgi:O-antigen ligase